MFKPASVGDRRHVLIPENPGPPVTDSDGGFTQPWALCDPPTWHVAISPASARDLERVAVGTVLSTASHIVRGRYHPGITTKTRLTKGPREADGSLAAGSRQFTVTGVANPEERNIETVAVCVEVVA